MTGHSRIGLLAALAVVVLLPLRASAETASRGTIPLLVQVSHDECASPLSYHSSQVEPSTATHGSTIVSAFQVGRVYDGGSCDIGWATSTDSGQTWQHGLLPLTIYGGQETTDAGPLTRASDPSVAYDAQDGVWLIDTLGLAGNADVPGMFVNRSTDGGLTWGPPIATHVATGGGDSPDKNWITCDNWPSSAGYGNCYEEYDNSAAGDQIKMQTSTDGGLTWSPPANLANNQTGGIGGVPVVQPPPPGAPPGSVCGRVVVPIQVNGMGWYTSTNCGATWSAPTQILPNMTAAHTVAGGLRTSLLPASAVDGGGAVYAVWQTRSFRTQNTTLTAAAAAGDTCVRLANITGLAAGQTLRIDPNGPPDVVTIETVGTAACSGGTGATFTPPLARAHASGAFVTKNNVANNSSADPNDIALAVMPAPTDANPAPNFGAPVRIPVEPDSGGQSNTNDHFIPGIGADSATTGATAHLGLFYYTYRVANCQAYVPENLCTARVGYVSSLDGGTTWSPPRNFGAMTIAEIPRSSQGPMVGDYAQADVIAAGPCHGRAIESFAVGLPPQPDDNALFEAMYAPRCGLTIGPSPLGRPQSRVTSSTELTGRAPVTRAQIHPYRTAH